MDIRAQSRLDRQGKLDERANLTHVVPSNAVTDSIRLTKRGESILEEDEDIVNERPIISFIVVYTMIFFNGCE